MTRIKVRALQDLDFCKKWEVVEMKETIYTEYFVWKVEVIEDETFVKNEKLQTKQNKAILTNKNTK